MRGTVLYLLLAIIFGMFTMTCRADVTVTPVIDPTAEFQVVTPNYKVHIIDGNIHSLRVFGVEFLDDRVPGSAGASFFVEKPLPLPTCTVNGNVLTATDGTYTVRYEFSNGFFTVALNHTAPKPATFITVCSTQVAYVRNTSPVTLAVAPADCTWGNVRMIVPTGEFLDLQNGTGVWGRKIGRQVWERGSITPSKTPRKEDTLLFIPGKMAPPRPTVDQLTQLSVSLDDSDQLLPALAPVELKVRFENNSNQPISSSISLHVESSTGVRILDNDRPFTCQPHEVASLSWTVTPKEADFYQATCAVTLGGANPKQALTTFGYDVANIKLTTTPPADFTEYWKKVTDEAQGANIKLTREPDAGRTTATVKVERLTINVGEYNGTAWLATPKFPGRYPALIILPGDHVKRISPNEKLAELGFVVLSIEPTGQNIANGLQAIATKAFNDPGDPAKFGYRAVMLHYLQALKLLKDGTIAEVDPGRIAVTGVGLGGSMALMLGALDPQIQAVAPDMPSYCYIEQGKNQAGWPYPDFVPYLRDHPKERDAVLKTLA
ncbi:MAG: acetylxylan esterase, partial [Methylococcaceae bacterium]